MATTASKPRSARAAASEAASVSRATATQKRNTPNASSERMAKGADPPQRATASKPKASGASQSKTGRTSKPKPKSSASKSQASASKPKSSASKPKAGSSKPKASSTTKSKTAGASRPRSKARSGGDDDHKQNGSGGENPLAAGGKHLASALFSSTSHRPKKHPIARTIAKKAAKKTLETVGRRSLNGGGEALRNAAENAGALGRQVMRAGMSRMVDHRPPVQAAVDVAAPISVVWQEWMTFEWFTEGLHAIEEIERDGDELTGRVVAPHERDWHAEIVDEREQQAFAWRSDEGTDCAGLVTFHRLSDRLTRVEADLDVLPTNPGETFLLSLPVPARRAERVLQMFKAHVEFINPDTYEEEDSGESDSDDQDDARAQSDDAAETE